MKRSTAVFVVLLSSFFSFSAFSGEFNVPNQNIQDKLADEFKAYAGDVMLRFTSAIQVEDIETAFQQMETQADYKKCIDGGLFVSKVERLKACDVAAQKFNDIFKAQAQNLQYWNDTLSQASAKMDAFMNTILDNRLRDFAKYQQDILERNYERLLNGVIRAQVHREDVALAQFIERVATYETLDAHVRSYRTTLLKQMSADLDKARRHLGGKVLASLEALKNYPNVSFERDPGISRVCGMGGSVERRFAHCTERMDENHTVFIASFLEGKPAKEKRYHWYLVGQNVDGQQFWRDNGSGLVWMTASKEKMPYKSASRFCTSASYGFGFNTSGLAFAPATREEFDSARARGLTQVLESTKNESWAKPSEDSMLTMEWAWSYEGEKGNAAVVGADDLQTPRQVVCVGHSVDKRRK